MALIYHKKWLIEVENYKYVPTNLKDLTALHFSIVGIKHEMFR